jgi:hypothetical protein
MKTRIPIALIAGIGLFTTFESTTCAQTALSNLVSAGKTVLERAAVTCDLHGAAARIDSAARAGTAARVLDRVRIGSVKAMVAETAPDGPLTRRLDHSLARLEAEAAQYRVEARDPSLPAERRERMRQLAAGLDRRVAETRELKFRLGTEHLKLKAELDRLERGTEVSGSQKLKRFDKGNESLRRAADRLDRHDDR